MVRRRSTEVQEAEDAAEEATENVTAPPIVNNVTPSVCRKCGCQEKTDYHNTRTLTLVGIWPDTKREYKALKFRDCRCAKCGQRRTDRTPVYVDGESE